MARAIFCPTIKASSATASRVVLLAALWLGLASPAWAENLLTCRGALTDQNWPIAHQECLWAAKNGEIFSQVAVAYMHYMGQGVPRNFGQASKWFRRAAEAGNALAQNNLGYMYSNGQGLLQNYVLAHMWYNLAAAQGEKTAGKNRLHLERRMPPAQIAQAQILAEDPSAQSSAESQQYVFHKGWTARACRG